MRLYADSSAVVKYYLDEEGSAETRELLARATRVALSILVRVEVPAAFTRAFRERRLRDPEFTTVLEDFAQDWAGFVVVPLDDALAASAATLVSRHPLRAMDAIHLASAVRFRAILGEPVTFATFDRRLWEAAAAEGFEAWPLAAPRGA